MIAAIYARVSTDEQAERGTSLETQLARCRAYAHSQGAEHIWEFTDPGVSGKLLRRPGLDALRELVKTGEVSLVVVWDPDRLARSLAHQLLLTEEIERSGARLEFVNFERSNDADGQLFYAIRGAIAEFEHAKIVERTHSGKVAKAKAGSLVTVPQYIYGYRYDKEAKTLRVFEPEAVVVRMIFNLSLEIGSTRIAQHLNRLGIPTRKGKRWFQVTVLDILRNRTYTGHLAQMGVGVHRVEPIIDDDLWERAQAAISARLNHRPGHPKHAYLLSGRVFCARCGRAMTAGRGTVRHGRRYGYYVCNGRRPDAQSGNSVPCMQPFFATDMVDKPVWEHVWFLLTDPERLKKIEAMADDPGHVEQLRRQEAELMRQVEAQEEERQAILRLYRRRLITEEDVEIQLRELKRQRVAVDEQLQAVQGMLRASEQKAQRLTRLLQLVEGSGLAQESFLSFEERRRLLQLLEVGVALGPGRGEIEVYVGGFPAGAPTSQAPAKPRRSGPENRRSQFDIK